jgi:hypothetical protein
MAYSLFSNRQLNVENYRRRTFKKPQIIKYFSGGGYKTTIGQEIRINDKQNIRKLQFIIRKES